MEELLTPFTAFHLVFALTICICYCKAREDNPPFTPGPLREMISQRREVLFRELVSSFLPSSVEIDIQVSIGATPLATGRLREHIHSSVSSRNLTPTLTLAHLCLVWYASFRGGVKPVVTALPGGKECDVVHNGLTLSSCAERKLA